MNASSIHHQRGRDDLVSLVDLAAMLDEQRRFRTEQIAEYWARESSGAVETPAEREVRDILFRGAVAALNDINAAIDRMAHDTYGRCVQCDEQIPLERLEILPQSSRCLPCERSR